MAQNNIKMNEEWLSECSVQLAIGMIKQLDIQAEVSSGYDFDLVRCFPERAGEQAIKQAERGICRLCQDKPKREVKYRKQYLCFRKISLFRYAEGQIISHLFTNQMRGFQAIPTFFCEFSDQ